MAVNANGLVAGYQCPWCGFDEDAVMCEECGAIVKWDDEVGGAAHCTGCGMEISDITCGECGEKFPIAEAE